MYKKVYRPSRIAGVTRRRPALAIQRFVHSNAPVLQSYRSTALLPTVQYGSREHKIIQNVATSGPFTVNYDFSNPGTGTQTFPLNLVSTGTDYKARIGRKIMITNGFFRYSIGFTMLSLAASYNDCYPTLVRVMIVYDKAPSGTNPPNVGDILDLNMSISQPNGVTSYVHCGNNMDNRTRFVTLYDKTHNLGVLFNGPTGLLSTTMTGPLGAYGNYYLRKRLPVVYSGSGNTWADIKEGAILFFAVSNKSNSGVVDAPAMNISYRIRFTDD